MFSTNISNKLFTQYFSKSERFRKFLYLSISYKHIMYNLYIIIVQKRKIMQINNLQEILFQSQQYLTLLKKHLMACRNLFPDSNSFQTPVKKPKTKNKMKRVFESNDSVSSLSNRDPDNIMNVIHKKRKPIKKQGLSINFFDPQNSSNSISENEILHSNSQQKHRFKDSDNNILPEQIHFKYVQSQSKRASKKTGLMKMFFCPCDFAHHSQKTVKKHMICCIKFKSISKNLNRQKQVAQKVIEVNDNILPENFQNQEEGIQFRQRISDIQFRLQKIEKFNNKEIEQDKFYTQAKRIYKSIQGGIEASVVINLSAMLNQAHKAGIKYENNILNVQKMIIAKIGALDFTDCVINFSDKLKQVHLIIQSKISNKTRTYKNNELAYKNLKQFNQYDLKYQFSFINSYSKLDCWVRKDLCRYWRLVKSNSPYFSSFPDIPLIDQKVARKCLMSEISIEDAGYRVMQIFNNGQTQLASDLWHLITLGLRYHDLLRVSIVSSDFQLAQVISITQRKNNNEATRYIPSSLVSILLASKANYPMGPDRARKAVRRSLLEFKSAYGFKHRVLTSIVSAVFASSKLGRLHLNPSTTANHYLDQNYCDLIDNAFKFPVTKFLFSKQIEQKIKKRKAHFKIKENQIVISKQEKTRIPITIDCKNPIEQSLQTSMLDGKDIRDVSSIISTNNSIDFESSSFISQQFQAELLPEQYSHISEAISHVTNPQFIQRIQKQIQLKADQPQPIDYVNGLKEISQKDICFLQLPLSQQKPIINQDSFVIVQCQNKFYISEDSIPTKQIENSGEKSPQKSERICKTKANLKFQSGILKSIAPNCPICRVKLNRIYKLKIKSHCVYCQECDYSQQFMIRQDNFIQYKLCKVMSDSIISQNLSSIKFGKNNLKDFINEENQISKNLYDPALPQTIHVRFPELINSGSKTAIYNLIKNEKKLGLVIKESKIPNSGLGVYTTVNIETDQIIACYFGIIAPFFHTNLKSCDIFTLGWLQTPQGQRYELMLDASKRFNVGRFINSARFQSESNAMPRFLVIDQSLVLIIQAKQKISAGSQILYQYGRSYWEKST